MALLVLRTERSKRKLKYPFEVIMPDEGVTIRLIRDAVATVVKLSNALFFSLVLLLLTRH